MILVKPSWLVESGADRQSILSRIELAGRTCYKSDPEDAPAFVEQIMRLGHESVIEHVSLSVRFVVDRGVSHELVRHRLASYSQESTRYCNYKGGVAFIIPPWTGFIPGEYQSGMSDPGNDPTIMWFNAMLRAEGYYLSLLDSGWTPQQARSVLPNSLKTEIVMTCNLREWRHVFDLRTSVRAHPQMREVMIPLYAFFANELPEIFPRDFLDGCG